MIMSWRPAKTDIEKAVEAQTKQIEKMLEGMRKPSDESIINNLRRKTRMTNRENLQRLTNRELAKVLLKSGAGCEFCSAEGICIIDECESNIEEWLRSERED